MPNHIQNRLTFKGTDEQIQHALNLIKSDEGDAIIDFNKIVEMPPSINTDMHSGIEDAIDVTLNLPVHSNPLIGMLEIQNRRKVKSPLELSDEDFEKYIIGLKNVKEYGHKNWYGWCTSNWGTKWNAYGTPDNRDKNGTIFFQTAWSSPIKLVKILSGKLPDVEIDLIYADEDTSSNTGRISFKAGEVTMCYQPESGTKDGYDIYFELNPEDVSNYRLVDGKFEHIEE